jgi:hypothetical protein
MGEIAEAMVNGQFCEDCGAYVDDNKLAYFRGADHLYEAPEIRNSGFPIYHEYCGPRANELDLPDT